MTVAFAIAGHAPNPLAFFLLLLPVGLMIGSTEIILNVEADRTEHLVGWRIMNRAHSFWSIGFFAAGLCGAGVGQLGMSPQLHLALVVPISAVGVALVFGGYTARAEARRREHRGRPVLCEADRCDPGARRGDALGDADGGRRAWTGRRSTCATSSTPGHSSSGFAVALFAFSQATTRFFADSFVDRHSPSGVARVLLCVMAAGVLLVFFSPAPLLSLLGFALLGIGTSAIFPLAISAAAQRTDRSAAINVAALAQISFVIFLVGPPLLGFVAEHWGIRWAFGLGMPLVVLSLLMAARSAESRRLANADGDRAARQRPAAQGIAVRIDGTGLAGPPVGIDGRALELQLVAPGVEDVERVAHAAGAAMQRLVHDLHLVRVEMGAHRAFVERAQRDADMIDVAAAAHRRNGARCAPGCVMSHRTISAAPHQSCSIPSFG